MFWASLSSATLKFKMMIQEIEDDLQNEGDLKNEEDPKNEDNLKKVGEDDNF